ncbi:hypothetical protein BKA63DRAFT_569583 [Paraphoma chrysanthemicola]|nr:hypothetical protein BKA63DRAFT_569583 [Paraphoma chrysanthemicola]
MKLETSILIASLAASAAAAPALYPNAAVRARQVIPGDSIRVFEAQETEAVQARQVVPGDSIRIDFDAQATQIVQVRQNRRKGQGGRNGAATQAGQGGNAGGQNAQPTQNPAPAAPVGGQNPEPTQIVQNPAPVAPVGGQNPQPTQIAQNPAPVTQGGQAGNGQNPQPTEVGQGGNAQNPAPGTQVGQTGNAQNPAPVTQEGQAGNAQNPAPVTQVVQAGNGQSPQPTQIVQARQVVPGDSIVVRQNAPVTQIEQGGQNAPVTQIEQGGRDAQPSQVGQGGDGPNPQPSQVGQGQNPQNPQPSQIAARQNSGGSIIEFITLRQNAPVTEIVQEQIPQPTQIVQARQNEQSGFNEDVGGPGEDIAPENPQEPTLPSDQGNRNSAGEEVVRHGRRYAAPQASRLFQLRPQASQVVQARQNSQNQNEDFAGTVEDNTPSNPQEPTIPDLPPNDQGNRNSAGEDFASPGKRSAAPQNAPPLSSFGDTRLITRQQAQAGEDVGPSDGGFQPPALSPIPSGPLPPIEENSAGEGVVVISARQNFQGRPVLPLAPNAPSTGPGASLDGSNSQGVTISARQQGGAGEGDSNGAPLLPPARNPISTGPPPPIGDDNFAGEGVVISTRQNGAAAPIAVPPPTRPVNSRQIVTLPDDPSAPGQTPPRDARADIAPPAPSNPEDDAVVIISARQADARLTRPNEQADREASAGNAPSESGNRVVVNARQIVALPDDPSAPEDPVPVDVLDA